MHGMTIALFLLLLLIVTVNKSHGSVTFRVLFARNVPAYDFFSDTDLLVRVTFEEETQHAEVKESANPIWPKQNGSLIFPDASDNDTLFVQLFDVSTYFGSTYLTPVPVTIDGSNFYTGVTARYGDVANIYFTLGLSSNANSFIAFKMFDTADETIVKSVGNDPTLSTLQRLIGAAGLEEELSGEGPLTLFAPTNEAFARLPPSYVEFLQSKEGRPELVKILTYHVVGEDRPSFTIFGGSRLQTLEGQEALVTVNDNGSFVDDALFLTLDTAAGNGAVHRIDAVLFPDSFDAPTIVEILKTNASTHTFSTLLAALDTAQLTAALVQPGPLTLLAPTDEAFAQLPQGLTVEDLLLPENRALLTATLLYHVVPASVGAAGLEDGQQLVTASSGRVINVTVTGAGEDAVVMVQGARVLEKDIAASNGLIHTIDRVMVPRIDTTSTVAPAADTLADLVAGSPQHTVLRALLQRANLTEALAGGGGGGDGLTLFAPTDEAFARIPPSELLALEADANKLKRVLLYHVVGQELDAAALAEQQILEALSGEVIEVGDEEGRVTLNGVRVDGDGVQGSNGRLFVLSEGVLLPPSLLTTTTSTVTPPTNGKMMLDVLQDTQQADTLLMLIGAAQMLGTFAANGTLTVFAPTNAAFQKLPQQTLEDLQKPENKAQLQRVLQYHVSAAAAVMSADLVAGEPQRVPTLVDGLELTVEKDSQGVVSVNGEAVVVQADVAASNGVAHVIDQVLLPPSAPSTPSVQPPTTTSSSALTGSGGSGSTSMQQPTSSTSMRQQPTVNVTTTTSSTSSGSTVSPTAGSMGTTIKPAVTGTGVSPSTTAQPSSSSSSSSVSAEVVVPVVLAVVVFVVIVLLAVQRVRRRGFTGKTPRQEQAFANPLYGELVPMDDNDYDDMLNVNLDMDEAGYMEVAGHTEA